MSIHDCEEYEKKRKLTCVVCRTFYSDKGQQTGVVWGLWGPNFKVCKWCVQAGRDAKRDREQVQKASEW